MGKLPAHLPGLDAGFEKTRDEQRFFTPDAVTGTADNFDFSLSKTDFGKRVQQGRPVAGPLLFWVSIWR